MQILSSNNGLLPLGKNTQIAYVRWIGIYLLGISLALLLFAFWDMKINSGSLDLISNLFFVPFALGLIWSRKWALWCVGSFGCLGIAGSICLALIHSVSPLSGLSANIGSITITDLSPTENWLMTAAGAIFLWIPMMSVLTKLPDRPGTEKLAIKVETAWLVLMVAAVSAFAAGIMLWVGVN